MHAVIQLVRRKKIKEEKKNIASDKISFLNYITVGSDSIVCMYVVEPT